MNLICMEEDDDDDDDDALLNEIFVVSNPVFANVF